MLDTCDSIYQTELTGLERFHNLGEFRENIYTLSQWPYARSPWVFLDHCQWCSDPRGGAECCVTHRRLQNNIDRGPSPHPVVDRPPRGKLYVTIWLKWDKLKLIRIMHSNIVRLEACTKICKDQRIVKQFIIKLTFWTWPYSILLLSTCTTPMKLDALTCVETDD